MYLGITRWHHTQSDNVLVGKRRQLKSISSLKGDDCDTDHYQVVITIRERERERLSLKKEMKQNLVADRCKLNKLLDDQIRKEFHIDVAISLSVLQGLKMSSVVCEAVTPASALRRRT